MKSNWMFALMLGGSLFIAAALNVAGEAHADAVSNAVTPCSSAPAAKGKSPQRFDAVSLMVVAKELESQGEADFHLHYTAPADECLVESFSVGDVKVQARYGKWEKAPSALLYRFLVERSGGTGEVLVLYSGTASLLSGRGYVFHVSEEKEGVISWYAMFKEEPTYAGARALLEQVIAGSAKPLMVVRWPPGAKEGEIMALDSKRLK
jgi:hypothetical protein